MTAPTEYNEGSDPPTLKWGNANFYERYCEQKGKPLMLSETGATFHLAFVNATDSEGMTRGPVEKEGLKGASIGQINSIVEIKENWWKQLFDPELVKNYPKIKAFCFFEFVKSEETTWRDFTNLGSGTPWPQNLTSYGIKDQRNEVLTSLQEKLKSGYGDFVLWGNAASGNKGDKTKNKKEPEPEPTSALGLTFSVLACALLFTML